jgi:LysM repeat protein
MAPRHRQARWLAPLALVACAVAVGVVVRGGGGGSRSQTDSPAVSTRSGATASRRTRTSARPARTPRRYTIKPGDTLSGIAVATGVPLATIVRLNPGLDTQTLQAGQTVKLEP